MRQVQENFASTPSPDKGASLLPPPELWGFQKGTTCCISLVPRKCLACQRESGSLRAEQRDKYGGDDDLVMK